MSNAITITGYSPGPDVFCDHCGRALKHGIRIDDGRTVGATCLTNKMSAPKTTRGGKSYRLPADAVVSAAKVVERAKPEHWDRYGVNEATITFPRAA